ncbi:hypothetical protein [Dactylosporangium sp. CS-033363]|uniref:hypothetical protein n=1 Tax=Dactylosporangium sp. CS-033363 TaxID=3239935 RepID=UPI003D923B22
MRDPLPAGEDFTAFDRIRLDEHGTLLLNDGAGGDGDGGEDRPVPVGRAGALLETLVDLPPRTTDIFVFVHGWQTGRASADAASRRLFSAIWRQYRERPERYPALEVFRPYCFSVQWPSRSLPTTAGYRRIRDRAHAMTSSGYAAHVIAALLGRLDHVRESPRGPATLRTAGGQYLHCVGHSFGCRFLGEAIRQAADPPERVLAWPWASSHAYAVDTFLGLQMAAPADVFQHRFRPLVDKSAPIAGPVVLTVSPHDRALSTWHRLPEGGPGLGAVGATGARTIPLRPVEEDYTAAQFEKLTNVDAQWVFRDGPVTQGAHSDIWYAETVHLLLSLAALAR